MGVLACDRYKCDNIMCNMCVESNYICRECKEEFKNYVLAKGIPLHSDYDIKRALKQFMETEKAEFDGDANTVDIEEFFSRHYF